MEQFFPWTWTFWSNKDVRTYLHPSHAVPWRARRHHHLYPLLLCTYVRPNVCCSAHSPMGKNQFVTNWNNNTDEDDEVRSKCMVRKDDDVLCHFTLIFFECGTNIRWTFHKSFYPIDRVSWMKTVKLGIRGHSILSTDGRGNNDSK